MNRLLEYLKKHLAKKRWHRAAAFIGAVVVFCTTYMLILPAITMTKGYPSLTAETCSAWSGDELTVTVKAGDEENKDRNIYVLTAEGNNADLSEEHVFNEEGICIITDTEGREIELHRAIREDGKGAVDYWFSLEAGECTEFTLKLSDSVDVVRYAETVEAMKNAAEVPEETETASPSDASRKDAAATSSNASRKTKTATPSNARTAVESTASVSDAVKDDEDWDDGFSQLPDGEILNDLDDVEDGEATEIVSSLKLTAGFGKDFHAAVKDGARNADKRGDGQLKFTWKDVVVSERVITPEMFWSGDGAQVLVVFDGDARLPAGSYLSVEEIPYGSAEYEQYLAQAQGAVITPEESGTEERAVNFARFFDITILDPDGNEIEPAAPVRVIITCDESIRTREEDDVNVLHFKQEQDPVVVAAETVNSGSVGEEEADAVAFTAESFSVYGVVTTTIEKIVLASDGHTYKITVTCGAAATIPRGAELSVREILPEDASGTVNPEYEDYTASAGSMLGFTSAEYYRLFDISIVDGADPSVRFQPKERVDVRIELLDAADSPETFSVLHFDEEAPEQLEAVTEGNTVSFSTGGFSAYAIVRGPELTGDNGWTKVESVEELAELSGRDTPVPFYISHKNGYYFTGELFKISGSRTGIKKTALSLNNPEGTGDAVLYYFEKKEGTDDVFYVYCLKEDGSGRSYIRQSGNSLSFAAKKDATAFKIDMFSDSTGTYFRACGTDGYYWNMQGGNTGKSFAAWNNAEDENAKIVLEYKVPSETDPYDLDGKTYGLMHYNGGSAGRAMTSSAQGEHALGAAVMTIMTKKTDRNDKLYVPKDSDIAMWTFDWESDDQYYISMAASGDQDQTAAASADQEQTAPELLYLNIGADGISLSTVPQLIKLTPGSGSHAGQIRLSAASSALVYSGEITEGFVSGGLKAEEAWLDFVELSDLTKEYFKTYSAAKVSVSDTSKVTNGSRVIIYTRVWNETKKRYEFYALGHDGALVPCYESGDSIEWNGTAVNTLLWDFTEYYYEGTTTPNYYYELCNQYSHKYIAPQIRDGQLLSDEPIGININGRRYGDYYSTILAWDDPYYTYAGLRVENWNVVSGPMSEAEDFYFALMQDVPADDNFTEVPTVEHTQYGITMKMKDFDSREQLSAFLGSNFGTVGSPPTQGLLTTDLSGTDGFGYPSTTPEYTTEQKSLGTLFEGAVDVNNLFIESIYSGTGYFEFDSTQNYAYLDNGTFKVYKELGTNDSGGNKTTLKHGQFFPYNMMQSGVYASVNGQNLYSAEANLLPDTDPRKYEQLHLIAKPDYHFGMEMSASFVQTPDGRDAWGHDIIFEFSGDDDFWLYVDGELVIDLGGIHSALPGTVNFCTGEVSVNHVETTLYDIFRNNYIARDVPEDEIESRLDRIFEKKTVNGVERRVFRDYSSHTMRMFYMERGAGASNLHMRFNLSAVKPGQVLLQKKISGTEKPDYKLAEYAYQIQYRISPDTDKWLNLGITEDERKGVTYQNTSSPVEYMAVYRPAGGTVDYDNVFFLSPGQIAAITLPKSAYDYRVIECGVNDQVYDEVRINDQKVEGTGIPGSQRSDYVSDPATAEERMRIVFDNHVKEGAIRTLSITKKLFDVDGTEITDDPTIFSFRLYLGNENAAELTAADLHDYFVKDSEGNYCIWDFDSQSFQSLEKYDYADLTEAERKKATFQTSPNGAISKIPAGYHVEVRNLLVGTKFRVEERAAEIPVGYKFIAYKRVGATYITGEGDTVNSGRIRDNESPAIEVHNRRGFGMSAEKVWSDADFMESHGEITMAVFVKEKAADGSEKERLLSGSKRILRHPDKTVTWYWDNLESGADLTDYVIREVTEDGENVIPVEHGQTLTVRAKAKESEVSDDYVYTATYAQGEITGAVQNVRTDIITNSRHGIRIEKKDWSGEKPVAGAVFELTDPAGNKVGEGSYTSGEDGLVTVAYLNVNTVYTLTETKAPAGYQAMQQPLKFVLHADGTVDIIEGSEGYYSIVSRSSGNRGSGEEPDAEEIKAVGENLAVLTVKNRPFLLRAVKHGLAGGSDPAPLGGAHFALHREVTVDGTTTMELDPMEGYGDLVSDSVTGIIPMIDQTLPAGVYFLDETETPLGYKGTGEKIKFAISKQGAVTLFQSDWAVLSCEDAEVSGGGSDPAGGEAEPGTRIFTITVKNELSAVPVVIVKIDQQGKTLENAVFNLSGPNINETGLTSRIEKEGGDAVIYQHDALPIGTYTLTETKAPDGFNLLEYPVEINVTAESNGIMVYAALKKPAGAADSGNAGNIGDDVYVALIDPQHPEQGWKISVSNALGYEMPHSGGPGTRTISILGVILVLLGGSYLLISRRKKNMSN